jgi:hypothetical protein
VAPGVLFETGNFLVESFDLPAQFVDLTAKFVGSFTTVSAGAKFLLHTLNEFTDVAGFFWESGEGKMFTCFAKVAYALFRGSLRAGVPWLIGVTCLAGWFGSFLSPFFFPFRWCGAVTRWLCPIPSFAFLPGFGMFRAARRSFHTGGRWFFGSGFTRRAGTLFPAFSGGGSG